MSIIALRIETEQLKKDNTKLLGMLKGTKEFESFGNFVEDSGGKAIRIPEKEQAQQEEWVPQDAFEMAYAFRSEHGNDLSPELIN